MSEETKADGTGQSVENSLKNANKLLSKIPIQLDGEPRILEYTMYSIIKLDEECGINLFDPESLKSLFPDMVKLVQDGASEDQIGQALLKSLKPRFVTQLLWAGLVSNEPDLTLDEVARRFKADDLVQLVTAFGSIQEGIDAAMPSDGEQKKSSSKKETQIDTRASQ
jgi:hypothetical protein